VLTMAPPTDDVDDELARDCRVVARVADHVVRPGDELGAAVDAADVAQPTTASADEHRSRPRHVTGPSQ